MGNTGNFCIIFSFQCNPLLFSGYADEENQINTVGTYGGSGLLSEADVSDMPSGSLARESAGLFPQPLHVTHRWDAEEAFVLPIEVGGILVAHARGRYFSVEVLAQHQTTGLLQPEPLLELQGGSAP